MVPLAFAAATVLSAISFAAGYRTSLRRHEGRVYEAARRQMLEALVNCIKTGLVDVNDARLHEAEANDAGTTGTTLPPGARRQEELRELP